MVDPGTRFGDEVDLFADPRDEVFGRCDHALRLFIHDVLQPRKRYRDSDARIPGPHHSIELHDLEGLGRVIGNLVAHIRQFRSGRPCHGQKFGRDFRFCDG